MHFNHQSRRTILDSDNEGPFRTKFPFFPGWWWTEVRYRYSRGMFASEWKKKTAVTGIWSKWGCLINCFLFICIHMLSMLMDVDVQSVWFEWKLLFLSFWLHYRATYEWIRNNVWRLLTFNFCETRAAWAFYLATFQGLPGHSSRSRIRNRRYARWRIWQLAMTQNWFIAILHETYENLYMRIQVK